MRCSRVELGGLVRSDECAKISFERRDQTLERRNQHRTFADIDEISALGLIETELDLVARSPRLEHRAASRAGRHGANGLDLRVVEPALRERGENEVPLPGEIGLKRHVLQRAAAATPEMRAARLGPPRTRFENFLDLSPLTHSGDPDEIAWHCVRDEIAFTRHAIASMAEFEDFDDFAHSITDACWRAGFFATLSTR